MLIGAVSVGFCLWLVFSGRWILPQTLGVGPVRVHIYGVTMALAVLAGFYVAKKRAAKFGVDIARVEDILFWLVIVAFVGARLYHVFSSWNYYLTHPSEIVMVWHGGLGIYGALVGGLVGVFAVRKFLGLKLSALRMLDWLTPAFVVGQAIGRFGNLFNYEAYGYPTHLPWKMFVPPPFRLGQYGLDAFYHPLFFYESLASVGILFFLLHRSKKEQPSGTLFFSYLLLYNTVRFFLEFWRIDSVFIGPLRLNVVVAAALVVLATVGLVFIHKRSGTNA